MSDDNSTRFARLGNTNYAEWAMRMEAALVRRGLWNDGQLAHMTARDPMEVWENLERLHRAAGFATSLALRRKFLTAKKMAEETMEAWIGRIQTLVLRMEHAGIEVTGQDQILALTMGLPPSYDAVIINFDATPPEQLTVTCCAPLTGPISRGTPSRWPG
ncbi:hypothetical protein C8R45DRAFT_825154 [Mycena sanguinolenta]|nr:hypothetical protein C8R45DRAFT_825154 [Mycena sanguinolenta]